jgi:SAM-dependent methyltransferase
VAAHLEPLRCPTCRAGHLAIAGDDALVCQACGARHLVQDRVAYLVPDAAAHQEAIANARSVNPLWYQDEQPAEVASPWRHHMKKRRLYVQQALRTELARRGVAKVQRLLDLGCGDGNHLRWLADFADEVYGCDYNPVRLARARAQLPDATLFMADILDFPAFDGMFDIVFFNHVIEHIPDDIAALRTVKRILRPGGLVVLGTPNEGAFWWQLAYKRDPESLRTTDHVHFYTAATLTARMKSAGLAVEDVHHMGWGPPDWRLDGRIRRYKLVDDAFELVGRLFLKGQASSLYVLARG